MKKSSVIIEIKQREGGTDSKLLVEDQARIYMKAASRRGL
jgi:protein subunit release factor A